MQRLLLGLALVTPISTATLAAQATNDEARLTVGVIGGWIGGGALWSVTQPMFAVGNLVDQFALERRLRSNITVAGQLSYFPRPNFGWTGEVSYIGIGSADACALQVDNNDPFNQAACQAIDGRDRAASGVALSGGVVLRPMSRGDIQPYFRANLGLALVPRSTTAMTAFFGEDDQYALLLYDEDESRAAKPLGALSFGLATAPRAGYQFRLEARATAIQLEVVDGPAADASRNPMVGSKWVILPSISFGMDIVLEKRRGRRY
jgi:hypothetical protein